FFSSRRRHTRFSRDWSSDVCSSDLGGALARSYIASTHDAEIFDRNVRELANIVAAIEHGIASGRGDATLAAIVLFWPLVERGMRSEERRVGKGGIARWVRSGGSGGV